MILDLINNEFERDRMGSQIVTARLADVLLVEAIRAYASQIGADKIGWFRTLADARIGRALRAMHDDVAYHWTVASLANVAGMSRASFSAEFSRFVGQPPLTYLRMWCLTLARAALGINMGTRFCATKEAPIHDGIKQAIVANDERATELLFRSYRNTARVAKNSVAMEAVRIEREGEPFESIAYLVKGQRGKEGLTNGDPEHGIWTAGMVQGLIHDIPSVRDLVDTIVADAEEIIANRLSRKVQSA